MPSVRLYLRPLCDNVKDAPTGTTVPLTRASRQRLVWWRSVARTAEARHVARFRDRIPVVVHTDASTSGWGGAADGQRYAQGCWLASENAHINCLEKRAVRLTLESLDLRDSTVLLMVDSTAALYTIIGWGSRSDGLRRERERLWRCMFCRNVDLRPTYLGTHENVWADRLSRRRVTIPGEIRTQFVDLLASWASQKVTVALQTPFTHTGDGNLPANEVRIGWPEEELPLLSPPWETIPEVVAMVTQRALLVVPKWSGATWWPLVLQAGTLVGEWRKEEVYVVPFRGVTDVVQVMAIGSWPKG